jgi:hypothetical protein
MRSALADPDLFGSIYAGESFAGWRVLLIAIVGEKLSADERIVFQGITGREREPGMPVEEFDGIFGRRSGKTRSMGVLAAYIAAMCDHSDALAPGERAVLPILSASLWQANKAFQYLDGIFTEVATLKNLVTNKTADTISLSNGVDLECRPASFRTIRGVSAVTIICDELAFWRSENSANPDKEILDAARPALATTGGMLIAISSPYAKRGELWNAFKRDYGPTGDPRILVAKAASRVMNATLPERVVARAYERDAAAASSEYGAEFRNDIEAFVSIEAIENCVSPGVTVRPPLPDVTYFGFTDPSGGSADSMTMAIAHREGDAVVLDYVGERKAPFAPDSVVVEFAAVFAEYRISTIRGDRYAGEWPRERFAVHGINYMPAEMNRSELYLAFLPLLNSGRLDLLDNPRMATQFVGLERRTARSGKDSVDHAPGAHDDVANAVAGVISLASGTDDAAELWKRAYPSAPDPRTPAGPPPDVVRAILDRGVPRRWNYSKRAWQDELEKELS